MPFFLIRINIYINILIVAKKVC